jgi:cytochrome c551/c552
MQTPFRIMLYLLYTALAILIIIIVIFFASSPEEPATQPVLTENAQVVKPLSSQAAEGLKLFKESGCSNCHDLCTKKMGPALKGVSQRRKRAWIHKFVLNSGKMREQKDPEAMAVFEEYGKIPMPPHEFLKPEEIDKIISYIDSASCGQQ